jgi:hypothetical protein
MHAIGWIIAAVVLLWPTDIGPEELPVGNTEPKQIEPTEKPKPAGQAKRAFRKQIFQNEEFGDAERQIFLQSFKRQAAGAFMDCLRAWRESPFDILLIGDLQKSGQLRNVKLLGEQTELPSCAMDGVKMMNFKAVSAAMKSESQVIQWRVDW